ncbi:MAG TPA: hypothetical protein VLE44_01830 [Candidatus Saccharimonadales bacterium]|nr:hypothetical protein [Candidatus Saccharimonadales bacterium]
MLSEHASVTTKRFIRSWQTSGIDPKRLAEELVSVSDETNRRLNKFHLIAKDGELIDPSTNKIISFERHTNLEKKEGKVWDDLKNWANNSEEGSAIWTSPQLEGIYPCDKVVYYQIAYTFEFPPQKIILSTAILLDTPKGHFDENLRDQIIIKDGNFTLNSLLEMLGKSENSSKQIPSQEKINFFVNRIKRGEDINSIVKDMQNMGILGNYSISCPATLRHVLTRNSTILDFSSKTDRYGSLEFECPHCRQTNTREYGKLMSYCQHCGENVKCG